MADSSNAIFDAKVKILIQRMTALGYPVTVTSSKRTAEEQAKLYAKGRSSKGQIVTEKSGAPGDESRHQKGLAADFAFIGEDGRPSYSPRHPWQVLGREAKAIGLEWGGDWTSLVDRPHVQLPEPPPSAPASTSRPAPMQARGFLVPGSVHVTDSQPIPPPSAPASIHKSEPQQETRLAAFLREGQNLLPRSTRSTRPSPIEARGFDVPGSVHVTDAPIASHSIPAVGRFPTAPTRSAMSQSAEAPAGSTQGNSALRLLKSEPLPTLRVVKSETIH